MADGDRFYIDLRESMCHSYFYFGEVPHERFTRAFFDAVVETGDTFVDLGANVGYFTRQASGLVGDHGRVLAYEPMPSALRLLRRNVEGRGNVEVRAVAISDTRGQAEFAVREFGDTSSLAVDEDAQQTIEVETDTLDHSLADLDRLDVLKVDVEGFELEVFKGAQEVLRRTQPLIYFECLVPYLRERGQSFADFESVLGDVGYSLFWMNPDFPETCRGETEATYVVALPDGHPRWKTIRESQTLRASAPE